MLTFRSASFILKSMLLVKKLMKKYLIVPSKMQKKQIGISCFTKISRSRRQEEKGKNRKKMPKIIINPI